MKRLIVADVFAAIATALWLLLFYSQTQIYTGAWDRWVYASLGVSLCLLTAIVIFNFVKRSAGSLAWIAALALIALPVFAACLGGGV